MESFVVYIIYSKTLDLFYKGYTSDLIQRIKNHVEGKSQFTSQTTDWELVYSKEFPNKKQAILEEKRLKKLNRRSIEKLINDFNSF